MADIDQSGFDNQYDAEDWVDAEEAAALLGVKRATLYAYASRGLLERVPDRDGRRSLYARAEVERLRARSEARAGHGPVAAAALRWGEPVVDTAISDIAAEGPLFRGVSALELVDAGFEACAELLWTGERASHCVWDSEGRPALPASLHRVLTRGAPHPVALLSAVVPLLALRDATRFAAPEAAEHARARRLIPALAASLAIPQGGEAYRNALEQSTVAGILAKAFGAGRGAQGVRALDTALVVMADHELNASSFTARVAASSGADLYACLSAALGTLSGPKHGGACDRIEALLDEIDGPADASAAVQRRLRRGEAIPGFGHPLYPAGDRRCDPLLADATRLGGRRRSVRTLLAVVDAMAQAEHPPPAVDIALVTLAEALGLPRGSAAAIFALGRCAGWVAHALEQRAAGFLLRPRARYVGRRS